MSQELETIAEKAVEWTVTAIIGGLAGAAIANQPSLASSMEFIIPVLVLSFVVAFVAVGLGFYTKVENEEIKKSVDDLNGKMEELINENKNGEDK